LVFAGFFLLGNIAFYANYKINVIERKWAKEYGTEYPYYTKFKLSRIFQYNRAYYIHFYRYKLFAYLEDQVIDPLNDNVLSPRAFDVYQFKRLIRAIQYDKKRDCSFDFLSIGEDDIEEFEEYE